MESNINGSKLKIGNKVPEFDLPAVDGKSYSLDSFKDKKILVIVFMCNHCPYVQANLERINKIQDDFSDVEVVGINSNDEVNYPEDNFENMIQMRSENKINFIYLRDDTQKIAKLYGAQCTPEVFVVDEKRTLRYHGRVDDNYKDEKAVSSHDLRNAVEFLTNNKEVEIKETPAVGCSIKWL